MAAARKSGAAKKARSYTAIAAKYCANVLSGAEPACEHVRRACQRQVDDLKKKWGYRFDRKRADRVCSFIEKLPHVKGSKFVGRKLTLEPWQCFVLTTIYGWVDEGGQRRFRKVYLELPKGSGKSALSSGVALYSLGAEGEPGGEIYSAATTREQAKIVFDVARQMALKSPEMCDALGIQVNTHDLKVPGNGSVFKTFSSDANSVEGCSPYLVVIDELHAHPSRELYDNLETAATKRPGSLLWSITTAGNDRAGVCYEVHEYAAKVLDRSIEDENFFGIIFTIDEADDWSAPASWRKANPNWGVSVFPDAIEGMAKAALSQPSKQQAFKTKHLNIWVGAHSAWMNMERFLACADPRLDEDDFVGEPCVLGLDLASKLDLLALVKVFWREIAAKLHYYAFGTYWTPEARIAQSRNAQYRGWQVGGWLRASEGETNDYSVVGDEIRAIAGRFQVLELCHDPWQAHDTMTRLQQDGIPVVQVKQLPQHLSDPMKEFEAAVYDGRFHFNGDPVLAWAVGNVVCKLDKNDNYFPNKEKAENKIDPATALFTAMNGVARQAVTEIVETSGVTAIGPCAKCGADSIGRPDAKGTLKFLCGKHGAAQA